MNFTIFGLSNTDLLYLMAGVIVTFVSVEIIKSLVDIIALILRRKKK